MMDWSVDFVYESLAAATSSCGPAWSIPSVGGGKGKRRITPVVEGPSTTNQSLIKSYIAWERDRHLHSRVTPRALAHIGHVVFAMDSSIREVRRARRREDDALCDGG